MIKNIISVTAIAVLMLVALPLANAAGNTANAGANAGALSNSGASSNGNRVIMNGGTTRIPLNVPQAVAPQVPVTPFFGSMSRLPAVAVGIPADVLFLNSCNTTATRKHPLKDVFATGGSRKTMVVWSPSRDYFIRRTMKIHGDKVLASQYKHYSYRKGIPTETVRASFPDKSGKYECLGLITVQAKEGNQIPLSTVASDGRIYALQHLYGYEHINLISVRSLIAASNGVKSAGSGLSIAPGLVAMASSALTAGALSAGYTNGGANTHTSVQLGTTFFVVSKAQGGGGVSIGPKMLK